jgi:hypothetical protein
VARAYRVDARYLGRAIEQRLISSTASSTLEYRAVNPHLWSTITSHPADSARACEPSSARRGVVNRHRPTSPSTDISLQGAILVRCAAAEPRRPVAGIRSAFSSPGASGNVRS